jgi:hypothetical protein
MKGVQHKSPSRSFKVSNTGKSPVGAGGLVHTKTGAAVPSAYAAQNRIVSRIASRSTHIKKGGW